MVLHLRFIPDFLHINIVLYFTGHKFCAFILQGRQWVERSLGF